MPNPIMVPADPSANLAKGFANIADLFAPPTARDTYYGAETQNAQAKTAAERAKAARQADVYARGIAPGATMQSLDLPAIAAGVYAPNQSTYAVDQGDATKRFGITTESGDRRYNTDSVASTSRANNADNINKDIINKIMEPTPEGSSVVVPPEVAAKYGVPAQRNGIVKLQPGQTATLPPGPAGAGSPADGGTPAPVVLQGNPQMPTKEQAEGKIIAGLSPEEQHAIGVGAIPARPVYGTPGGTAQVDPVTGQLRNTQDKTPLPVGTKATNLSAPTTTVNVGPNGETFGAPPANMAWKRNPDNTVALDDRGAPIALPIGGSPLADKQAKQEKADKAIGANKTAQTSVVTQDIDRAIAQIQADPALTTGLGAQLTNQIGGSPGFNTKSLLDTVKANAGLERLQALRDESPTGAALGRVTNQEISMLQAAAGNLDPHQESSQLVQNLKRFKDNTLDVVHGPGQGPARSTEGTAMLGGRRIIARGGQWVDEATGQPVGTAPAP